MNPTREEIHDYIQSRMAPVEPGACAHRDNRDIVYHWMDALKNETDNERPRPAVEELIHEAYDSGYEHVSDGCTLVDELQWPIKHPTCVGHDWLYYTGQWSRAKADRWMLDALCDFGHPLAARIRWFGLRTGGWYVWRKHRKRAATVPGYGTVQWVQQNERCILHPATSTS